MGSGNMGNTAGGVSPMASTLIPILEVSPQVRAFLRPGA
jgi:hypothetical protein